jgi:hypothetical protein
VRVARHELVLEPRQSLPPIYTVLTAIAAIVLGLALSSVLFLTAGTGIVAADPALNLTSKVIGRLRQSP